MAQLQFKGKTFVHNHHLLVKYHELVPIKTKSLTDKVSLHDNLIVHGDNLKGLKALLPLYAGKIKCVYIDPPYNTGNEGWAYNDNVNSPMMQDWLGKVVDREDLTRHDKWLCMMMPRLKLIRELMTDDGAIFVSIDDNEVHHLRMLMDEVFGEENFVATVLWQKIFSPKNTARHFSEDHDYIVVYARNAEVWMPELLRRSDSALERYENPDNDPRGAWSSSDLTARNFYSLGTYEVTSPGGVVHTAPRGRYWVVNREKFAELGKSNRVWWGPDGKNMPRLKRFLSEVKAGVVPQTLWLHKDVGHTQDAKKELLSLVEFKSSDDVFVTVKPSSLIRRILAIATDKNSIILDSFAGSGTTAHAVLAQNAADGGTRRFILIECEDYADTITAERVRRVIARQAVEATSPSLPEKASGGDAASTSLQGGAVEATSPSLLASKSGEDAAFTSLRRDAVEATSPSLPEKASGGDAASTLYFDPKAPIGFVKSGNLPHWRQDGATYFVTWRTADSMPRERIAQWTEEREEWIKAHPETHDEAHQAEYDRLFPARWERWLDEGHGECLLANREIRAIVEGALREFDAVEATSPSLPEKASGEDAASTAAGTRYRLGAFVVMPNHVHALVTPIGEHLLSDIVQAWKSFTAHAINKMLQRKGAFWQKESFDHIVRNGDQLERIGRYIRDQAVEATSPSLLARKSGGDAASTSLRRDVVEATSSSLPEKTSGGDAASTLLQGGAVEATSSSLQKKTSGGDAASTSLPERASGEDAASATQPTFSFFKIGKAVELESILEGDNLPAYSDLARYVFYTATGEEFDPAAVDEKTRFIGESRNYQVFLFYAPDVAKLKNLALTLDMANALPKLKEGKRRLVFAPTKYLDQEHLDRCRIDFAQLPFEIYELTR